MNNVKILYYFKSINNVILCELKRLDFKNNPDKSKYVSWFIIKDNVPTKLNFKKIENNIRFFEKEKIILEKSSANYIENDDKIILENDTINNNIINLCLEIWK